MVNVLVQPEPPGLMTGIVQNGPTQLIAGNIYEGLLRYDEKLAPQPQLATSWSVSPDSRTYTFKLKPDVKLLFLTGHSDSDAIDRAVAGRARILKKPVSAGALSAAIDALID